MIMVTILVSDCNDISQDFYDGLISSLELINLVCPCCHHGACMSVHGYYYRQVRDSIGDKHPLRVMRTKCSCCHHTSAILPSVLVPYSQIPLEDQNTVIDLQEKNASSTEIADAVPSLDENNVKSIIRRYVKHWLQRLLAESIPRHPLKELTCSCFQHYSRPFLQIHRTPNILFLIPT